MGDSFDDIGRRMAFFRKDLLGESQKDFADSLGLSTSAIGMIESGKQQPSSDIMQKLIEKRGMSIDWLLTGKGQPHIIPDDHFLNTITKNEIKILGLVKEKLTEIEQTRFWSFMVDALKFILGDRIQ